MSRVAQLTRTTAETDITLRLSLDGSGRAGVSTGVGFFDHMLTALARHAGFDLDVDARGDLHIFAAGPQVGDSLRELSGVLLELCLLGGEALRVVALGADRGRGRPNRVP